MVIGQFPCGGENVTNEVNAQTPIIADIMGALGGRITNQNASEPFDFAGLFGYTKIAIDKFTLESDEQLANYGKALSHSLGENPKFAMLISEDNFNYTGSSKALLFAGFTKNFSEQLSTSSCNSIFALTKKGNNALSKENHSEYMCNNVTSNSFTVFTSYMCYLAGNIEYTLITMA